MEWLAEGTDIWTLCISPATSMPILGAAVSEFSSKQPGMPDQSLDFRVLLIYAVGMVPERSSIGDRRTSSIVPFSSGACALSFSFNCFRRCQNSSMYPMGMQKLMPMNMMVVIIQGFLNSLVTPERSGPSNSYTAHRDSPLRMRNIQYCCNIADGILLGSIAAV